MVDSLLRLRYAASDPVAATTAARAVLGSAEVSARPGRLSWDQVSLVDDGITVSSLKSAGDGVCLSIHRSTELLVVLVRSGSVHLRNGEHDLHLGARQIGLVPIGVDASLRWDRVHLELFSIPPAPIARLLGVPRHAVRLHAPRADPRSDALAAYFRQAAKLLTAGVFGMPEIYARDLVRAHAIDTLTAITVEAFELTNESEDDRTGDVSIVRRALAEMRAHLAEPISVPEIAQAAGVSVRGLQMAFQRQLDVSPLLHLRQMRLESARASLVDDAESGTTVAEVARRFGYANSGRFSTHFRNEFGESPAATLQRIRSTRVSPDAEVLGDGVSEAQVIEPT